MLKAVSSTINTSGLTASTALALNANKEVVSVTNTGTGNNVLSTSPVLTTPNIGAATATSVTSNNTSNTVFTANIGSTNVGADIGSFNIANTCTAINFNSNYGATVGSITVGATTAYNTISDYRLKQNVQPMTGRLAEVMKLNPVTYNWTFDNSPGNGFIAHELAEVFPFAVTGEKDAVNEDGSIKPQSIDVSFLVPTLWAAIQEQQAQIEQLKADVAVLKGV